MKLRRIVHIQTTTLLFPINVITAVTFWRINLRMMTVSDFSTAFHCTSFPSLTFRSVPSSLQPRQHAKIHLRTSKVSKIFRGCAPTTNKKEGTDKKKGKMRKKTREETERNRTTRRREGRKGIGNDERRKGKDGRKGGRGEGNRSQGLAPVFQFSLHLWLWQCQTEYLPQGNSVFPWHTLMPYTRTQMNLQQSGRSWTRRSFAD